MANLFGLLLLTVVIIFTIAILLKDAKAFPKYMAILGISLLVGTGARALKSKIDSFNSPEKTVMIEKVSYPTCTSTPFVTENGLKQIECMSQDVKRRDNFLIQTEGLPIAALKTAGIDDS